jgi:hypothetical protein
MLDGFGRTGDEIFLATLLTDSNRDLTEDIQVPFVSIV